MAEIRRWFDSHSSPQAVGGFDPLASGYITSGGKVRLHFAMQYFLLVSPNAGHVSQSIACKLLHVRVPTFC